jgi:glutamate 5-kinase
MYLENSKTIIVKIGSSLIIDDKKIIRKKWLLSLQKILRL